MRGPGARAASLAAAALLLAGADAAPVRIQRLTVENDVAADGSFVQVAHLEKAVATDAAARQEAQFSITFSDAVETVSTLGAYTLKPDGRHLAVPPGSISVRLAPGVPNVPMFTDRKQLIVSFPDAQGGDVLVMDWRRTVRQPVLPGEFMSWWTFAPTLAWDDLEMTTTLPPGRTLKQTSVGPAMDETAGPEGRLRYHWHYAAPATLPSPPFVLSPMDHAARLFASTVPDWPAFSRAWAALSLPKAAVTPAVQTLADKLVGGSTDPREEVARLSAWVASHVRWVAVYLGNGSWVPHSADEVLAAGMGDCKDQVVLLVALLAAEGIEARPVLINLDPTYHLGDVPIAGAFNHVITFVPDLSVYVDTTASGTPGILPFSEFGKPILPITQAGAEAGRMDVLKPGQASAHLRSTMTLGEDGVIKGTSATKVAGPWTIALNTVRNAVGARGGEQAASDLLRREGFSGTGMLEAGLSGYGGSFSLEPHPEYLEGEAFRIPTGLRVVSRVDETLLGPLPRRDLPATAPTPCFAGESSEILSLSLPPGLHPERMPADADVKGPGFHYESHWRFAEGVVSVERSMHSEIDQPLCEGELRRAVASASGAIERDVRAQIALVR